MIEKIKKEKEINSTIENQIKNNFETNPQDTLLEQLRTQFKELSKGLVNLIQ